MYAHLQRKLLLATCIALAACQSTGERAATLSVAAAAPAAVEAARLLGTDGFDRVELDGRGLRLLDPQGQVRPTSLDVSRDSITARVTRGCCWRPSSASRRCSSG